MCFPQHAFPTTPHQNATQPLLDCFRPRWPRTRHNQRGILRGLQGSRDRNIQRV